MQKIPERKIRSQTPDNYNSLSENENETWRAPHHGENESVLGSEGLQILMWMDWGNDLRNVKL